MSAQQSLPPRPSQLLNPTDPAEQFIAECIEFLFAEAAGRYQVLSARWVDVGEAGQGRRLVVQAVRRRAGRRGRPAWFVMVWDVDARGVTFLPQRCKAVMWERYRDIGDRELQAVVTR